VNANATTVLPDPGCRVPRAGGRSDSISGSWEGCRSSLAIWAGCVSFANLCFVNVWGELQDSASYFNRKYTTSWTELAGLLLNILITAVIFRTTISLLTRVASVRVIRVLKWLSASLLVFPLYLLYLDDSLPLRRITFPTGLPFRLLLVALIAALAFVIASNVGKYSTRVLSVSLLILLPALPLAALVESWKILSVPKDVLVDNPLAAAMPQPGKAPRVVWIIFDEWDYSLTFQHRPANLDLSEIDRLRRASFHATHAYPPATQTIISVPSLLTGQTFVSAKPWGDDDVQLTLPDQRSPLLLSNQTTIFTEARARGLNVGIVGWYLPYCRIFSGCASCFWQPATGLLNRAEYDQQVELFPFMWSVFQRQIRKVPFAVRMGGLTDWSSRKQLKMTSYEQLRQNALSAITDPRLNLLFLHWNIPHPFAIYSAAKESLSSDDSNTYVDNLRLVDRTILELREALEKAGLWDKTTILFTADHPLRVHNWEREILWPTTARPSEEPVQADEIPFLLKMAGQTSGMEYSHKLRAVGGKDLLLAILAGKVTKAEQVAAWFDSYPSGARISTD
jgi:hypothetical protein